MNVNNIAGNNSQAQAVGQNADIKAKYKTGEKKSEGTESRAVAGKGDKLELSAEALKLQPVREKLEEGYYDRADVIRKVAEKIDDEFETQRAQ
jgi:hypothetical protein